MAITKREKISIAKWYIRENCFCNEQQTRAKETKDLAVLEEIIKKDKSMHCCERCIHDRSSWCRKECERQRIRYFDSKGYYDCFRFKYGYWRKVLIAQGEYENVLNTYN